jgi:prepilin-type N-terminal cleavage/methylation domain-containing protein
VWHPRESVQLAVRTVPAVNRRGLTLLEVMVALVILGLVATGFLEAFAGAFRATADARTWAQALVYAEEGQETVRRDTDRQLPRREEALGGGFVRQISLRPWREGVNRVTVTVTLPTGARFELVRLVPAP